MQECCIFLNAFPPPDRLTPPGPNFGWRRGGFYIRPTCTRICRGVGAWRRTTSAAPYTQPYGGCRGEQCSPVESCAIVQLHGRTLCAPTTQLTSIFGLAGAAQIKKGTPQGGVPCKAEYQKYCSKSRLSAEHFSAASFVIWPASTSRARSPFRLCMPSAAPDCSTLGI